LSKKDKSEKKDSKKELKKTLTKELLRDLKVKKLKKKCCEKYKKGKRCKNCPLNPALFS